ncbi:hypothetical protein Sbs19_08650 [Sphingobium sp. BS19]|nr:hypothetical protein Sbs19_08650 [Sphingobium sp. BS19]
MHCLMNHAFGKAERADLVMAIGHGDKNAVEPTRFAVAHIITRLCIEQVNFLDRASYDIGEGTALFDQLLGAQAHVRIDRHGDEGGKPL